MNTSLDSFPSQILDAMPLMVLVVDDDVRALYANTAARQALKSDLKSLYNRRGGDVFGCVHASASLGGCGRGEACKDCVVRNSVNQAVGGQKVTRSHAKMRLLTPEGEKESHLLVTTAPFTVDNFHHALLTLEDISEVVDLKMLIPICSHCRRIRDDHDYWQNVEQFLLRSPDMEISHGICPDCLRKHYPKNIAERVLETVEAHRNGSWFLHLNQAERGAAHVSRAEA